MRLAGMQLAEVVCIVCFLQRDLQFCKIFVGVHAKLVLLLTLAVYLCTRCNHSLYEMAFPNS